MKRTISNPIKMNHKIYCFIILISLITLVLSFCVQQKANGVSVLFEILKNLSYGCIASTVVAWIIDGANTRYLNRKAHNTYDAVYRDLKFRIGSFIGIWAELCVASFSINNYDEEKNTWFGWYTILKENYFTCDLNRQKHLLDFFTRQLVQAEKEVNASIEYIHSQRFILALNDVMNDEMARILSDFKFEFHALKLDLECMNDPERFWTHMDAINTDIKNYINDWPDIKYYNFLKFQPYKFLRNTTDNLAAVLLCSR